MKIAVVGCSHGELDKIYRQVQCIEHEQEIKIDLLICCGDFQATRNEADLRCMSIPPKYYNMGSFYRYYSEEKVAPVLTIFIGGNHEASNYLQELPFGGWVAPRIYYLGYASVVNFGGLRIGGISGIYKGFDYMKGHFERAPYSESAKKSVYHIRNVEVFRLKQISESLDIMLSHDWPRGVYNYGCKEDLIKNKPFFEKEVNENTLGSKPTEELLAHLKPKYWFSAHLHTKFCATIPQNSDMPSSQSETKFMALDKCLPRRKWLEVVDIPTNSKSLELSYDLEWLTILHFTDHLMSSKHVTQFMPGPSSNERWSFVPTAEEKEFILRKMNDDLRIPNNFVKTAQSFRNSYQGKCYQPHAVINPQTTFLCGRLGLTDPLLQLINYSTNEISSPKPNNCSTPERFNSNDSTYLSFDSPDINTSFGTSRSSISSFVSSSPIISQSPKKPKLSFPSIIDKIDESTDSDILPFCLDRTGSANESSSSPVRKEFKRRNASLYIEQNE